MDCLIDSIRPLLPSSLYVLSQAESLQLLHRYRSYSTSPRSHTAYLSIFQQNNTWQLYLLDLTRSISYLIDPKSKTSLNVQLQSQFAEQLIPSDRNSPVRLHTLETPMVPDVHISGPFILYMLCCTTLSLADAVVNSYHQILS